MHHYIMLMCENILEVCDSVIRQPLSPLFKIMNLLPTATIIVHPSRIQNFLFQIYICFARKHSSKRSGKIFSAACGLIFNISSSAALKMTVRLLAQFAEQGCKVYLKNIDDIKTEHIIRFRKELYIFSM